LLDWLEGGEGENFDEKEGVKRERRKI